jgi:DNA-binding LytR/AlgR family response regulator
MHSFELYDGKSYHNLKVQDFLYAEADHVYVKVFLVSEEEIVARMTLNDLEQLFGEKNVWRCHRSYLVNTNHIKNRYPDTIHMVNGKTIPVSRSRKK